jgi:hypothetical protein
MGNARNANRRPIWQRHQIWQRDLKLPIFPNEYK